MDQGKVTIEVVDGVVEVTGIDSVPYDPVLRAGHKLEVNNADQVSDIVLSAARGVPLSIKVSQDGKPIGRQPLIILARY